MLKIRFTKDYPLGGVHAKEGAVLSMKKFPAHLKDYAEVIDDDEQHDKKTGAKKGKKDKEE